MVALTSTPAPHCLSTSNARRDAAGWSRLAALLQRPPSLSAPSGHQGQRWRLPCHPHLQFSLPAAPAAALQPQLTALRLPDPETWKVDPSSGEGTERAGLTPSLPAASSPRARTGTPSILPVGSGGERRLPPAEHPARYPRTALPRPQAAPAGSSPAGRISHGS